MKKMTTIEMRNADGGRGFRWPIYPIRSWFFIPCAW